jgi:hypothetical protein
VAPSVTALVEHVTFCAVGSNARGGGKDIKMTFGQNSHEKLHALLRSPLPPSQSLKVGKELAELTDLLTDSSVTASGLRPDSLTNLYLLEDSKLLGSFAVSTIEKRRCMYAFDLCARSCSNRAAGSGKFDTETLLNCLQNLADQLTRPEECSREVDRGCELVVRRCCEGLASFVRDRDDTARLNAVAECADVISDRIEEISREASVLSSNATVVHDIMMEDVMGLESALFDEYLENTKEVVANSVKLAWLDKDANGTVSILGN